jgi:hypothetical protein
VTINTSPWKCDALLVTTEEIRAAHLPTLTADALVEQANTYISAMLAAESGDVLLDETSGDCVAGL